MQKNKIVEARETAEIEPGEEYVFNCSECNRPLVKAQVTRSKAEVQFKLRAKCCYCLEQFSYTKTINGLFHLAPISRILDEETQHDVGITCISDVKYGKNEEDVITIETVKSNEVETHFDLESLGHHENNQSR